MKWLAASFSSHSLQSFAYFPFSPMDFLSGPIPPAARVQGPGGSPGGEIFLGVDGSFANKFVHNKDKKRLHASNGHGCPAKGTLFIVFFCSYFVCSDSVIMLFYIEDACLHTNRFFTC